MLIYDYNPKWPESFRKIRDIILEQLGNLPVRIEHVGSTSVPGLAAKPIIDIDIIFKENQDFAELKDRLEVLGYFHNGDQGIPGREAFKRNPENNKHEVLDDIQHHLYALPAGSAELERHLLFRDHLRKNAWARDKYRDLKMEIAREAGGDRKHYAALKETRARSFVLHLIELERNS